MHTGDLATMDADGYLNIVGRIKDMVIRGGENVYPREVEEFLFGHPAVADVPVVGVPDARYGEELCAWVRLRPGAAGERGRRFGRSVGNALAHFKVPRYVLFVDEFPMTVTGKIQKYKMREVSIRAAGPGGCGHGDGIGRILEGPAGRDFRDGPVARCWTCATDRGICRRCSSRPWRRRSRSMASARCCFAT